MLLLIKFGGNIISWHLITFNLWFYFRYKCFIWWKKFGKQVHFFDKKLSIVWFRTRELTQLNIWSSGLDRSPIMCSEMSQILRMYIKLILLLTTKLFIAISIHIQLLSSKMHMWLRNYFCFYKKTNKL